jgi:hypothetical protein
MKENFVDAKQINKDMDSLLEHYGAKRSQANLDKTRRILKRFGNVTDELSAMRDENR